MKLTLPPLRLTLFLFLLTLLTPPVAARTDTTPPPMTSPRLITLDHYQPDATYGTAYRNLLNPSHTRPPRHRQVTRYILPTLLLAYGTAARFNQLPIRQIDFDIAHEINKHTNSQNDRIDNCLEYGMPLIAYTAGFIPGLQARHNHRDRALIMATSFLIMKSSVEILKTKVPVERPRGTLRSFPSGHTAVTVWSAHIIHREYGSHSPWISLSGYLLAVTTGTLRMLHSAHWFSDVLMGAGIGLLSAEIGYQMLPLWHSLFRLKHDSRHMAALPVLTPQSLGLAFVYQF
jgi:hypothetical protein